MIWRFLILRPDGPAAIAFIQPVALLRMGGQSSVGSQNSKAEIQKAEIGKWWMLAGSCVARARSPSPPKRQGAGAVQDASRGSGAIGQCASVLDCGGPPSLFSTPTKSFAFLKPTIANSSSAKVRLFPVALRVPPVLPKRQMAGHQHCEHQWPVSIHGHKRNGQADEILPAVQSVN